MADEAEKMYSDIRSSPVVYNSYTLDSLWIVFYFHLMFFYPVFQIYLYMTNLDHLGVYTSLFAH